MSNSLRKSSHARKKPPPPNVLIQKYTIPASQSQTTPALPPPPVPSPRPPCILSPPNRNPTVPQGITSYIEQNLGGNQAEREQHNPDILPDDCRPELGSAALAVLAFLKTSNENLNIPQAGEKRSIA